MEKPLRWGHGISQRQVSPSKSWPLGKITEVFPDKMGLVRQVKVRTRSTVLCFDQFISSAYLSNLSNQIELNLV